MSFVHLHTPSEFSLLDGANRLTDLVPPGLDAYLPGGFDLVNERYTLDFEKWGGTPFMVGVTLITSDSILGRTALEMLASPKWNSGDKYTWVIE